MGKAKLFLGAYNKRAALINECEQLIDFQDKLDHARDDIADGKISEDELEKLEADLADAMPPSVAAQLSGTDPSVAANHAQKDFSMAAPDKLNMHPASDVKPADDLTL